MYDDWWEDYDEDIVIVSDEELENFDWYGEEE